MTVSKQVEVLTNECLITLLQAYEHAPEHRKDMLPLLDALGEYQNGTYEGFLHHQWHDKYGFCGCGDSEGVMEWMGHIIGNVENKSPKDITALILDDSDKAVYFCLYVLNAMGLLEHGGNVFSSIATSSGKTFCSLVENMKRGKI